MTKELYLSLEFLHKHLIILKNYSFISDYKIEHDEKETIKLYLINEPNKLYLDFIDFNSKNAIAILDIAGHIICKKMYSNVTFKIKLKNNKINEEFLIFEIKSALQCLIDYSLEIGRQ